MQYESLRRLSVTGTTSYESSRTSQTNFRCSRPGTNPDYFKYIFSNLNKLDRRNDVKVLTFALAPADNEFVKLVRGDYITIDTLTQPRWFTGYVVADPPVSEPGVDATGTQKWIYTYKVCSDDYLLNLVPLPLGLNYINTTQGAIIRDLINRLQPGMFDVTGIQDGLSVASYQVDPSQKFSDIIKSFADDANYLWGAVDHKLTYQPLTGMQPTLVIDASDPNFTPEDLQIQDSPDPAMNDCVVTGAVEPQGYMNEYFCGDGYTARFPLISGCYGASNFVWLTEDFSGSTIDTSQTWLVNDPTGQFLVLNGGFLNCLGGNNAGNYDVWMQTINPIPLEGNIRLTHGQYDIVEPSDGVICALYQGQPQNPTIDDQGNEVWTGLIYGIRVAKDGYGNTTLRPIVNTSVDYSQGLVAYAPYNYRYIIRTVATFRSVFRSGQEYSYIDSTGTPGTYGTATRSDQVTWQTWITTIDPLTGNTIATDVWTNGELPVPADQVAGYYTPIIANDLHCSVTGITISVPLQASLQTKSVTDPTFALHGGGDIWGNSDIFHFVYWPLDGDCTCIGKLKTLTNQASGWTKAGMMVRVNNVDPMVPFMAAVITAGQGGGSRYRPHYGVAVIQNNWSSLQNDLGQYLDLVAPPYWVKLQRSGSTITSWTSVDGQNWDQLDQQTLDGLNNTVWIGMFVCADAVNSKNLVQATFSEVKILDSNNVAQPLSNFVDTDIGHGFVTGYSTNTLDWLKELVGPNEIDAQDGMAPAATIAETGNGSQGASLQRVASYNPGQAMLEYFKDDSTQSSTLPNPGDLIHLQYRRAGVAIARVVDNASIAREAAYWGDSGHRASIQTNVTPQPRTSEECEAAAGAYVADSSYRHYEGTYVCHTGYVSMGASGPLAGTMVQFLNMPTTDFPDLQAEIIQQVSTTYLIDNVGPLGELFEYQVQFGKVPIIQSVVGKFSNTYNILPQYQDSAVLPDALDINLVLNATLEDVQAPTMTSFDANNFYLDTGQDTSGGFEIRYTDDQWGAEDGKNLITRLYASRTFQIPRNSRNKVCYIREFDQRNKLLYSEDFTATPAWTFNPGVTASNSTLVNPDGKLSTISTITIPNPGGGQQGLYQVTNILAAAQTCVFSLSLKGAAGEQIALVVADDNGVIYAQQFFTMTGNWIRCSVPCTFTNSAGHIAPQIVSTTGVTFQATRASLEVGTATETVYCKTTATPYGILSRNAAGVHLQIPMIPPSPTASIDYTDITAPIITVNLPGDQQDIWGYEIRDSDNTTVLVKQDLSSSTYELFKYQVNGNKTRNLRYYVYTYNVLNEYCTTPFVADQTIPTPTVTDLAVDDVEKHITWTGQNSQSYVVMISDSDPTLQNDITFSSTVKSQFQAMLDKDFFPFRYIGVTPYDAIGPGSGEIISHQYVPDPVTEFNNNEVSSIDPPATPTQPTTPPVSALPWQETWNGESTRLYRLNQGIYDQ